MHNVGFISGVRLEVGFSGQKSIMKLGFAIAILTVNLFVDNQSHGQYNKVLDEITSKFPNFNGSTLWIFNNFSLELT